MPRIRSLKPEFCKSESIAVLSIPARLHFAMLWTYCDDNGRGKDNPRLIKSDLWPLDDDVTLERIEELQDELAYHGRICRYEVDGARFFACANFEEHQHPNRKAKCTIPEPTTLDWQASRESARCTHCVGSAEALPTQESLTPVVESRGGVRRSALPDPVDNSRPELRAVSSLQDGQVEDGPPVPSTSPSVQDALNEARRKVRAK